MIPTFWIRVETSNVSKMSYRTAHCSGKGGQLFLVRVVIDSAKMRENLLAALKSRSVNIFCSNFQGGRGWV